MNYNSKVCMKCAQEICSMEAFIGNIFIIISETFAIAPFTS